MNGPITSTAVDTTMLAWRIREVCAREFGGGIDYPYFSAHLGEVEGETHDEMLVRVYHVVAESERQYGRGDFESVLMVMIHG